MAEGKLQFVNGKLALVTVLDSDLDYITYERLLGKARSEGVRLFSTPSGETFATSTSTPGLVYPISFNDGCACAGYTNRGACKHFAKYIQERFAPVNNFGIA